MKTEGRRRRRRQRQKKHTHTPPLRSLMWAESQLWFTPPPPSPDPPPPPPPLPRREMSPDSLHVLASKVREMSSMAKLLTLPHLPPPEPLHTHTHTTATRRYVRAYATRCAIFVCHCASLAVSILVARQRVREPVVTHVGL